MEPTPRLVASDTLQAPCTRESCQLRTRAKDPRFELSSCRERTVTSQLGLCAASAQAQDLSLQSHRTGSRRTAAAGSSRATKAILAASRRRPLDLEPEPRMPLPKMGLNKVGGLRQVAGTPVEMRLLKHLHGAPCRPPHVCTTAAGVTCWWESDQ